MYPETALFILGMIGWITTAVLAIYAYELRAYVKIQPQIQVEKPILLESEPGAYYFDEDNPNPKKIGSIRGVDVFLMRSRGSREGLVFTPQLCGKSVYISWVDNKRE